MGADVVKVEKPGVGDDTRHWGPPFMLDRMGRATNQAAYFASCNRNKKSITVDFATSEGADIITKLALESDVLVENYKVSGLQPYGLDYGTLSALNPRLIYCSVTGFGQTGPYAKRAGYDLLVQAASGMMSITGEPPDKGCSNGNRVGVAITDVFAGLYAATAILGALHERGRTDRGQHIDIALLDVGMAILANQASAYLNTGISPVRNGNVHPSLVPYQDFKTKDGAVLLAIGNDSQFARFAQAAGRPEWAQDPNFAKSASRVENKDNLLVQVSDVLKTKTTAQWIRDLEAVGVPCGPVNNIAQAFEDPQVVARGLRLRHELLPGSEVPHIDTVRSPIRYSRSIINTGNAPPALGEHTVSVLQDLGLGDGEIAWLRERRIV
jgi:formyl-CoA transferase